MAMDKTGERRRDQFRCITHVRERKHSSQEAEFSVCLPNVIAPICIKSSDRHAFTVAAVVLDAMPVFKL